MHKESINLIDYKNGRTFRIAEERRKARLVPVPSDSTTEPIDSLDVPGSIEEFESLGYCKEVVTPSEANGFVTPFAVWRRESEEGCELEVVGYPALLAWGENKADAYEQLFEFIHSNTDLLAKSDVRGSSLLIASFIREVVGPVEGKS